MIVWWCEDKNCEFYPGWVGPWNDRDPNIKEKIARHENKGCKGIKFGKEAPDNLIYSVTLDDDKPVDIESYNNDTRETYQKSFLKSDWSLVASLINGDDNFVTIRESNDVWIYNKTKKFYTRGAESLIAETAQKYIDQCDRKSVLEIIGTIQRSTYIHAADLFESNIINTLDGIIDPVTLDITPHSATHYTTSKLPFHVNNITIDTKLWNHILTIIDPADVNLLMELIWMYISASNPFKKMFIFKGLTNTQKTTMSTIITWIIGAENFSYERPQKFLSGKHSFSTSNFIGKRGNIASEIGNLTDEHIENQKSLIGGERQATERKGDNTPYIFDPTKFTFLYTTNELGKAYSLITDHSIIGRYQFMIFRNQIDEAIMDGTWESSFFNNGMERQNCIDTIVYYVINYKTAQKYGFQKKTIWSTVSDTKKILEDEMSIEDKYFRDNRLVKKVGSQLSMGEIVTDFGEFVGGTIDHIQMGHILKKNGYKTSKSNGVKVLKNFTFVKPENETLV